MAAPAGAAPDAPSACKIERPAGLWPPYFYEDYWNTYTHGGFNSDWVAHPRPVGTLKAIMLFVDFPDRPASAVTQTLADRLPHSRRRTTTSSRASCPWYDMASYGRLHVDLHPVLKWYRMPKASTHVADGLPLQ